jgi:hypothetical protein
MHTSYGKNTMVRFAVIDSDFVQFVGFRMIQSTQSDFERDAVLHLEIIPHLEVGVILLRSHRGNIREALTPRHFARAFRPRSGVIVTGHNPDQVATLRLSQRSRRPERLNLNRICIQPLLAAVLLICGGWSAHATVTAVSVQSPGLSTTTTANVTTPLHFSVTADSDLKITGYVVYIDGNNVYRSFSPSLDAWVVFPPGGTHSFIHYGLGFQRESLKYADGFDCDNGGRYAHPANHRDSHGEYRQASILFLDL